MDHTGSVGYSGSRAYTEQILELFHQVGVEIRWNYPRSLQAGPWLATVAPHMQSKNK